MASAVLGLGNTCSMTRASSLTAASRPLYCWDRSRSATPAVAASVTLLVAAPADSSRTSMNIGRVDMYLCRAPSTINKTCQELQHATNEHSCSLQPSSCIYAAC